MANLNSVQIIGNLGADPDVTYTQQGTAVANINVAVTEKWKDKNTGQQQEKTEWVRVTMFNRTAEVAGQYLKKGASVYIGGKMQTDKWTDKQGVERYTTKVIANNLQMLGSKGGDGGGQSQSAPPQHSNANAPAAVGGEFSDDVPFAPLSSKA